jgi:DNA-binding response OmpR family regulator
VTLPTPPIILIIDDDESIGRPLKRLADQSFAPDGFQVFWVKNGVAGVEMARQYTGQLRLIVLDVKMKLMNGTLAAVQIRRSLPQVPIMPFTSYAESLPALAELGCVLPVVKRPDIIAELPARMRQAMTMPVKPLPDSAWVTALQQSGDEVLAFVQQGSLRGVIATDGQAMVQVQRAVSLIDKYCRRINTPAAREIQLARKALQEVAVD